jgi:malonyl-CoA O-methyltransferase
MSTKEAYEQWAACYPPAPHNPLMRAEQQLMLAHWPDVVGRRALDLACGSGRYAELLSRHGAAQVTALDFSSAMLLHASAACRVQADMLQLPFADASFEIVISGLALGHAGSVRDWMAEVARVLAPGGILLYSDFHPDAHRAGMTRSFKDPQGQRHDVPHHRHELGAQRAAATAAGLAIDAMCDSRIGIDFPQSVPQADDFYRRWWGVPVVLVVRAHKQS